MSDLSFFATVPRGLESLLAGELRGLGAAHVKQVRAGVVFSGSLETAYRACLWSRLAGRVLLPVTSGTATDGDDLYKTAQAVDWSRHLGVDDTLAVDFTGVNDRIRDTRFGAVRIKDAIVDQFRAASGGQRPSVDARAPDVRVNAHLASTRVAISIDLSGQSLHRRGYRADKVQVEAPLKENLAAGTAAVRGLAERGRRRRQPAGPAVRVGHAADRGGAHGGRRRARPAARGGGAQAGRRAGVRLPALARPRHRALGRADPRGARAPQRRHQAARRRPPRRRHPRVGQRPARRQGRPRLRQARRAARPGDHRPRPAGHRHGARGARSARDQRPVRRAARRRRRGRLPAARRASPRGLPGVERRRARRRPAAAQGHRPRAQARDRPAQRPARVRARLLRGRRDSHRLGGAAHRARRGALVLPQDRAAGRARTPAVETPRPVRRGRNRRLPSVRAERSAAAPSTWPTGCARTSAGWPSACSARASPATGSTTPTCPSTTSSSTCTASGCTSRSTRRRPRSTRARPRSASPRRSRSSAPSSRRRRSVWCSRSAADSAERRSTSAAATPAVTSR